MPGFSAITGDGYLCLDSYFYINDEKRLSLLQFAMAKQMLFYTNLRFINFSFTQKGFAIRLGLDQGFSGRKQDKRKRCERMFWDRNWLNLETVVDHSLTAKVIECLDILFAYGILVFWKELEVYVRLKQVLCGCMQLFRSIGSDVMLWQGDDWLR